MSRATAPTSGGVISWWTWLSITRAGVQAAAGVEQGLAEQSQVASPVGVIQKARQTVVAALNHMLRDARQFETWLSGYGRRIGAGMRQR